MTTPTSFGLMRHTITLWNQSRRIQGQTDSPLTSTGVALALQWGQLLAEHPWSRILSSDLGRARKTAELINQALDLPLILDTRLREMDWGIWTGKTMAQLAMEFTDTWANTPEWDFCPPGGESFQDVWNRGMEALAAASGNWPGEKMLVVSHEGMIKSLIYHKSTLSDSIRDGQCLKPYHLHCLTFMSGRLTVERLNFLNLSRAIAS